MIFDFEKGYDPNIINEDAELDIEEQLEDEESIEEDVDDFNLDEYDFSIEEDSLDEGCNCGKCESCKSKKEACNEEFDDIELEGFDQLDDLFEEMMTVFDEDTQVLNEVNIVKMDKATLRKRLLKRAALICSKEAGDPLFKKYAKAAKAKKNYRQLIQQKYEGKAKIKLKQYLQLKKNRGTDKNRALNK